MGVLLRDPPEVALEQERGDTPYKLWPGRLITRLDLMRAAGDSRDWFRYMHRLAAYRTAWAEFASARKSRRDFRVGYNWNQILVLGEYGSGKTTLAVHFARHFFGLGHPVFSNAATLFGWRLELEEMYTAMGFMPKHSVMIIDEASAALSSRMGPHVAVSAFADHNLNIRKKNIKVVYCSAQDYNIASSVRVDCKEVWMPVPPDDISVEDQGASGSARIAPRDDISNFRLAWYIWEDYPYKKANLIEGGDAGKRGEGFGAPALTKFDEGENVRRAYLLNDTFELAKAGAAGVADTDVVKASMRDFLAGRGPAPASGTNGLPARNPEEAERQKHLLMLFQEHEENPPEFFAPGQIAQALKCDVREGGVVLSALFPKVPRVRDKGYPSALIYHEMEKLWARIGGEE